MAEIGALDESLWLIGCVDLSTELSFLWFLYVDIFCLFEQLQSFGVPEAACAGSSLEIQAASSWWYTVALRKFT